MATVCKSVKQGGPASVLARGYNGGGMTDWSLPSLDELIALYYYTGRNAIGGFVASYYWSSSQDNDDALLALLVGFTYGDSWIYHKFNADGVRPVRAF